MAYLVVCGNSGGPLFLFQDGQPLSRALLTWHVPEFQGIFPATVFVLATVAAHCGIPDHLIQALGRWSSDDYKSYIQKPSETLASLSSRLTYGALGP